MYLQVSEKVVYGLSCVALYIIYTIYSKYIYLKQQDTLDHIYTSLKQPSTLYIIYINGLYCHDCKNQSYKLQY